MKKFAFVFPGQGSQSIGMLDAYGDLPAVRSVVEEASDTLKQDIAKLVREGPAPDLNSTVNTQPVMVTVGVAVFRAWIESGGGEPSIAAGHSLGEYSALVASGALKLRECLPLVRLRAQAMQAAVPIGEGAMAALLGLEDEAVRAACLEAGQGEVVEAVNFNSQGQVVIAGHATAVERAIALAKSRGAKRAVLLPVSVPSHSSLMRGAAEQLRECLEGVAMRAPQLRYLSAVDAQMHSDVADIRATLVRQLASPVRWTQTVLALTAAGATTLVECGPGKVLTGLNRRIEKRAEITCLAVEDAASLATAINHCQGASHV